MVGSNNLTEEQRDQLVIEAAGTILEEVCQELGVELDANEVGDVLADGLTPCQWRAKCFQVATLKKLDLLEGPPSMEPREERDGDT